MRRFIYRRLVFGVLTMWGITIVVFSLSRAGPDPMLMFIRDDGYGIAPTAMEHLRIKWGLDKPIPVQYVVWIGRILRERPGQEPQRGEAGEGVYPVAAGGYRSAGSGRVGAGHPGWDTPGSPLSGEEGVRLRLPGPFPRAYRSGHAKLLAVHRGHIHLRSAPRLAARGGPRDPRRDSWWS